MAVPADSPPRLHLRIFIASPGDVEDERSIARKVIEDLGYDPLLRDHVSLEEVAWDTPEAGVPMLANMTPQAAIARGLTTPGDCDIVVVVLWSRMGTPLPADFRKPDGSVYLSGTEWEYCNAVDASRNGGRPAILLYRRTEEPRIGIRDPQRDERIRQYDTLEQFFAQFRNPDGSIRSGVNPYDTPDVFRTELEQHLRALIADRLEAHEKQHAAGPATADATPAATATAPPLWEGSPFPGLRAFTPEDAPVFFGRGRETDELVRRLADPVNRFLLIAGASGSGKSSLVAAGLLPRLASNAIPGSKDWLMPTARTAGNNARPTWEGLRFTPAELGDNPFQPLTAGLISLISDPRVTTRSIATRLESDQDALAKYLAQALREQPAHVEALVLVDQFEELFTGVAPVWRSHFLGMLAAASQVARVRIVATMRADFLPRSIESASELAQLLQRPEALYLLGAPRRTALQEILEKPAGRAGIAFEPDLVDRLLDDAIGDRAITPGALALLGFTLAELYRRRDGTKLTGAAYEAFGGVRGSIAARAEATFSDLPSEAQGALPRVFQSLIDFDDGDAPARQRASRPTLDALPGAKALIDAFVDARLLVSDVDGARQGVVEVAHEALLREWPRLAEWIAACRGDLRTIRHAQRAASEWARSERLPELLWPHERLGPVHQAMDRLGVGLAGEPEPFRSFARPEYERLIDELASQDTTHGRRAWIGERLNAIGDLRHGVGIRADGTPEFDWCEVPGTDPLVARDADARGSALFVSRYEVTWRQYRAFIEADDGWTDTRWWTGLHRDEVPGTQYRPLDNHPAENVSWFDAIAYCRWATFRLGHEVRLPTEWEWMNAVAQGDPSRRYPWGPDWEEGRANTEESRLARTVAVGMYPAGASAQGVLDLAGNVLEWCLNKNEAPDDIAPEGNVPRVMHGGSWWGYHGHARAQFRDSEDPGWRSNGVGFRVATVESVRGVTHPGTS